MDKNSEAWELASRIAKGEYLVSRLTNQKYMTYEVDGDEVLFGEKLKGEVEEILGVAVEEFTDPRYTNERAMRVPLEAIDRVKGRMASL